MQPQDHKICIVGLGYVGLPLAHAFAKKGYDVYGYDISAPRIAELQAGHDRTNELTDEQLRAAPMHYTADASAMKRCSVIILAIPTPVDDDNKPDLSLVESATHTVGQHLSKGTIVVYESTVYPGVTEEICGPIIEQESGLKQGKDFKLGYSPERINPGDKEHTIDKIMKIVAGEDEETLNTLADLYGSVVTAGIHRAANIKVAEMAKAIENAQRDLNIAFVNEIAMLCGKIGIPTKDVLEAAGTKWNFLRFSPGLVGGHCIGVDPYYLVEKARQLGMQTHVITAGRAINDGMACYIAQQVVDALGERKQGARVLVLGLTFKENIPDTRNSKAKAVIDHLQAAGCVVEVHEPQLSEEDIAQRGFAVGSVTEGGYDAVMLLVPHREYRAMSSADFLKILKPEGVFYDLKSLFKRGDFESKDRAYLAL